MTKTSNNYTNDRDSSNIASDDHNYYGVSDSSGYVSENRSASTNVGSVEGKYKLGMVYDDSERKRIKTRELNKSIGKILR